MYIKICTSIEIQTDKHIDKYEYRWRYITYSLINLLINLFSFVFIRI